MLPNLAGVAIAYLLLTIPQVVMIESFLSFLGLGVQEPMTSLGILLKDGADDMDIAPYALLLPGAVLVLLPMTVSLYPAVRLRPSRIWAKRIALVL